MTAVWAVLAFAAGGLVAALIVLRSTVRVVAAMTDQQLEQFGRLVAARRSRGGGDGTMD